MAAPQIQRNDSISATSQNSQTAQEFIESQLQLEADAREALPYQFDTCTRLLGPLRQNLFACLTCNPPPKDSTEPYQGAGVCYSCSISCHGDHTLVELFNKRDFVCDCGTARLPTTSPCTLRVDEQLGTKGNVHSEKPAVENKYNQNFQNRFCGCEEVYNPHEEKGTMFQCLGLGSVDQGGCGEDWWHPECVVGLPRDWMRQQKSASADTTAKTTETSMANEASKTNQSNGDVVTQTNPLTQGEMANGAEQAVPDAESSDPPLPPGFPQEEDFDHFICYKCVNAFPWIKRYANSPTFLFAEHNPSAQMNQHDTLQLPSKKRKVSPSADENDDASNTSKRPRPTTPVPLSSPSTAGAIDPTDKPMVEAPPTTTTTTTSEPCQYDPLLPPPTDGPLSLFLPDSFREALCQCPKCYARLLPHPPLLHEEESYEPPLSHSSSPLPGGSNHQGGSSARSAGTASLLDRGEAALSNVDRVRAIEGVMVYNHLRDKVKSFLQPFAESGRAVGAEDVKAYFETLRGDAEAIREAGRGAGGAGGGGNGDGGEEKDQRKEQGGY